MTASFNLVDERWIPCIRLTGEREELSLRETLAQAHYLREIHADSPLETAAIHRLLLAILHRVFGPKDRASWVRLWEAKQFSTASPGGYSPDEYLNEWGQKRRFDLFDDKHPFYQVADETMLGAPDNLNKMVHHVASGITATLFDHHLDTKQDGFSCTPAEAARVLLATQSFALGYQKFTDAPCAKGVIFFARGDSLFETLMLNLVRYPDDEVMPSDPENDRPAWEIDDPFAPDRSVPRGYLDYLTWQNRRLKFLKPEQTPHGLVVRQVAWAPGLRLDSGVLDPMKHYRRSKQEGWNVLSFSNSRALWRDSATLFQLSSTEDQTLKALNWLSRLVRHRVTTLAPLYRLMALGMAKDQAKVEFFRAELTPLPLAYLENEDIVRDLSKTLQSAEDAGRLLRGRFPSAIFTLARLAAKPATDDNELAKPVSAEEVRKRIENLANSWGVERAYWSSLGLHFHRLVNDLPRDALAALDAWRDQLRRAAQTAFEQAEACAGQDRRTQRAVVKAREQFNRGLWQILPIKQKEETHDQEPT